MTIQEIIDYVDAMKPSAFTPEQKVIWLNEVEGMAQLDVMELAQSDVIQYLYPDDKDHEPLVPPPHQKIYYTYMLAMIDFANGEYNKYQNTMALFNMSFTNYTRWFADHYRPADGRCEERGYYISAYSIAVKHGYAGTEEQWLASLKGDQAVSTQEAIAAAQAAAISQANAAASAVAAGNSASMATDKAGVAASHAGAAGNSAATAATKASEAAASAVTAGSNAAAASSSASSATTKANEASSAAQTAVLAKTAAETARDQAEAAALVQYDDVPTAGSLHPVRSNGLYNALATKADLASGKIPASQLPSYVDDVIEAVNFAVLPSTGETGKIYVTINDNKAWRWSGSGYVEISASLALGETAATAYRGDRGAVSYVHSQSTGNPHNAMARDIYIDDTMDYYNRSDIEGALEEIGDHFTGLAPVATTGVYSDLSDTPTSLSELNDNLGSSPVHTHSTKQDKIANVLNRLFYGSGTSGTLNQLAFPTTSGSVLRQDTSGAPYWGMPLYTCFAEVLFGSQQTIATTTRTKLNFNTLGYSSDVNGLFTVDSTGLKVNQTGYYLLHYYVDLGAATGTGTGGLLWIGTNNDQQRYHRRLDGGNNADYTGDFLMYMTAGEYVYVSITQGSATSNIYGAYRDRMELMIRPLSL